MCAHECVHTGVCMCICVCVCVCVRESMSCSLSIYAWMCAGSDSVFTLVRPPVMTDS